VPYHAFFEENLNGKETANEEGDFDERVHDGLLK
jgi:hypothetical protein